MKRDITISMVKCLVFFKRSKVMALSILLIFLIFLSLISAEASTVVVNAIANLSQNNLVSSYNPFNNFGLLAVKSASAEYGERDFLSTADAAAYGMDSSWNNTIYPAITGYGIEPMASVQAEAVVYNPYPLNKPGAAAGALIETVYYVRPKSVLLPGINIPLNLSYRLEAGGNNAAADASAMFSIYGTGINPISKYVNTGQSDSGIISIGGAGGYGGFYTIRAQAAASAASLLVNDERIGSSAQAISDPFLFIDPTWEYAQNYEVLIESYLNPGEWVEVTRMWQNPPSAVPIPAAVWLLGSGLVGLVAIRRRNKK